MNGLIITVNLLGRAGNNCKKEESFKIRHGEILLEKHIGYSGRENQICVKKLKISEKVAKDWMGECPDFIKPFMWKNLSKKQRIKAWVDRFDEGYGVSYEEL